MQKNSTNGWNVAALVLYVLLFPVAFVEFTAAGLAFGMSTDACHDAACDATFHPQAAILTVGAGIVVVLVATAGLMFWGLARGRVVIGWPLVGLLGLGAVFALGMAVVH